MVQINWGLATGPNSFDNALAKGFEIGSVMRQRQEETDRKNALAAYAKNPNEQTFGGLADAAPEYAMRARSDMEAQQARQQQQQQQQMATVRQLLAKAGSSPEGWAQAMGAAQSLGIDTSAIPQQYDPQWAQQQLFIMDALERDQDKLPGIAQELQAAGYQPGTPEFAAAMRQVINSKYASEYADPQGNIRRRSVLDLPPAQGAPAQTDPSGILQGAAAAGAISAEDANRVRQSLGPNGQAAFDKWKADNGIRVIARTGTAPDGRRVVQFEDGTIEYAN